MAWDRIGQVHSTPPTLAHGDDAAGSFTTDGRLRVDANVTVQGAAGGTSSSFNAAIPSTGTAAGASDGTNMKPLLVDGSGNLKVNIAAGSSSGTEYADGAARGSATGTLAMGDDGTNVQALACDSSGNLKANLNQYTPVAGKLPVDGSGVTQPVSAASLPLPSGAATSAAQTTGNASLSSIDGKTPALGQAAMAASVPVAIASNQGAIPITDNSGSLTVDNGGTFAVQAAQSGTWNITNVSGTVSLPTGAATAAKQPALGTAGTPSSDVITVQGAASMTALKVDGSAVTQPVSGTVTANIGTTNGLALDATLTGGTQKTKIVDGSGNVIGATSNALDVNIKSGASSGTQYTEDAAAAADPIGTALIMVRADSPAAVTSADGDNVAARATNKGELYVKHIDAIPVTDNSGSLTVDNGGTFPVQAAQSGTWTVQPGNTANTTAWKVDGSAVTQPVSAASLPLPSGAATAAKQPALGTAGSASADVITVQGIASMTALKTDGSAVTQPVSGAVTANAGTNLNTSALALESGGNLATIAAAVAAEDSASADADKGVRMLAVRKATPANTSGTDGDYEVPQMSAGRLWVSATVDAALPAGTNGIGKLTSNSGVTIGAVEIAASQSVAVTQATASSLKCEPAGNVAHDGADSGNPVKVGAYAINAERTAVANADRVDLVADLTGKQIVLPYSNPENIVAGNPSAITNTTSTSVIAAAGAGVRLYITSLTVTNSHATVGTLVQITDGSGGTVLWQGYAAAAGGGVAITFNSPLRTTANTALHAVCGTTGANVYVSAQGYKGA